jgi:hypothetical protein
MNKMFKVFLLIRLYSSCVCLTSIQNDKHIENPPQNDFMVPFRLNAVWRELKNVKRTTIFSFLALQYTTHIEFRQIYIGAGGKPEHSNFILS